MGPSDAPSTTAVEDAGPRAPGGGPRGGGPPGSGPPGEGPDGPDGGGPGGPAGGPSADIDPDYPVTPVPAHARKSPFSLAVVLLGFTIFTPTMLAGASLGTAFRFGDLLLILLLGSLILAAYVATLGFIGARTGLTTVVMARYALGTRGAKLASFLLGGTQVGWYAVIVGTIGTLTAEAFGWDSYAAEAIPMVLASALMCLTACYGYRGMYWVSLVSTPLIMILALWVVSRSLDEVGGWSGLTGAEPTTTMSFAVAVTTVVGTFVSAGTQAPNWTRFARTGRHAVIACLIGFLVGNSLMILFGAIGAISFEQGDFVLVLYELGLVGWGLFLLFGNLWKSNADTAYAFGVAGAELFERPSKTPFIVGGSIIGTVLALVGFHEHLADYLGVLGIFIPPLGGVIMGDWWRRWRGGMPVGASLPRFHGPNLAAYAVASALAWLSDHYELGIPPLIGIVVAVVLVLLAPRPTQRA